MPKNTFAVTQDWVQIGQGVITITVKQVGEGSLMFNESASDTNANSDLAVVGEQFIQNEILATYIRATGEGWTVLVDGAIV